MRILKNRVMNILNGMAVTGFLLAVCGPAIASISTGHNVSAGSDTRMGSNLNALFRSVPPSLYLALGMTEKDEKAQRRELMKAHGCTELEAAFMVARELDRRRGTGAVNET